MPDKHKHEVYEKNKNKTFIIIVITILTMIIEIFYGYLTHSMALLADGVHMGTHAFALSFTYIAYVLIQKFQNSPLFPQGTDKIGTLTAYTSSIFLGITGICIIIEALNRLLNPVDINFDEAIIIAFVGLVVNTICIFIMETNNKDIHEEESTDYNFLSAYYHILADALTSVLAIAALLTGKYLNIIYFDSLVGILGGFLIIKWAYRLIKKTIKILIDMK